VPVSVFLRAIMSSVIDNTEKVKKMGKVVTIMCQVNHLYFTSYFRTFKKFVTLKNDNNEFGDYNKYQTIQRF
jgi:hypothetical protein